jgi:hypothetical protein
MTIAEAISRVDSLKPNTYTYDDKVSWLSTLDTKVKTQVIDAHESDQSFSFNGYNEMTDSNQELLVPAPYDEMYVYWLTAMIDYYNNEDARYNNAVILFDNSYERYKSYYTRNNMPKSKGNRFVF